MSEMIANFLFLSHSYAKAIPVLEGILAHSPDHPKAAKKLVIAYIETGRLRDGYRVYAELMERNPAIILDTNPALEDCPCPQLVDQIETNRRLFDDPANRLLVLGIYSSYCDAVAAHDYFEAYRKLAPEDAQIVRVLSCLDRRKGG